MWLNKQPNISLTAIDESESTAGVRFNVVQGITAAEAMAAADTMRQIVQNLSDCTFARQHLTFTVQNQTPNPPAAGSDVKRNGVFIFRGAEEDQYAVITIPGWSGALETTGEYAGIAIDQTDSTVQSFIQAIIDELFHTPWGDQIVTLGAALLQTRG